MTEFVCIPPHFMKTYCVVRIFRKGPNRRPDAETVQGLFTKREKHRRPKQAERKHKKHGSKAEKEFRKAHS